ncbi:MAG: RNA-binding domain-containing protein [Chloroflexota bacterium]
MKSDTITKDDTTNTFALEFFKAISAKKLLYLRYSEFNVFSGFTKLNPTILSAFNMPLNEEKYDLIVGDFPIGMKQFNWETPDKKINIRGRHNWVMLFQSLFNLADRGYGVFVVEPSFLFSIAGIKFQNEMNNAGFYLNAVMNTPEKILHPYTSVQPIILIVSRNFAEKLYVAELIDQSETKDIASNFINGVDTHNLSTGLFTVRADFKSFYQYKTSKQVESLESYYKSYNRYTLMSVALEINSVRSNGSFVDKDNSIYIPKIGTSRVVSRLTDTTLKHQNYFQVVLRSDIVKSDYASLFFSSALGQLILSGLVSQTFIPHINKDEIADALIAIPSLDEQESIIVTYKNLSDLKLAVDEFGKELALNPTSSSKINAQLGNMLDALGVLTEADRIRALIREGETKKIEFKQTLASSKVDNRNEYPVLKTIVAFLNTEGGSLLVGVSDNNEVRGLDEEINKFPKKRDGFLLHFKNLLKDRIGEQYYPYIDYELIDLDSSPILIVDCKKSRIPCYLDQKDFFVRTNPATDKLEGPKLVEYVKQHFV